MQDAGFLQDEELPGRCWRHGLRTYSQLAHNLQHRVQQCLKESPAFVQVQQEAAELYGAMEAANITDRKLNYIGEQHRIVARAQALRLALESKDPTIKHTPWSPPLIPATAQPSSSASVPPASHQEPKPENFTLLERGEVTPYSALQSACLLLSAMFEKTPFNDTDIRKRVFADFATLKKEFRYSQLRTLHGPTTSVGELFGAIKDLDREGLVDNLTGVVFDDWRVYERVDGFLNSPLGCQATCLTQDGPVGRISCRLRTFVVIAALQERLLKDLFDAKFVGPPVRGFLPMTHEDPLDYYDFVEALVRNTPSAYIPSRGLYYAWLYAPEVNATPENWEVIFGKGSNRLPSLYDSITTPDDTVIADHKSDSGYSMDVDAALKHNYSEASSQSAVGFPWADDLIGAYLRERLRMQEKPSERNESPSSDANNDERPEVKKRRLDHVEAGASGVKEEPMELKEGSGSPGQPYSRMLSASEQQRQMQQRRRQLLLDAGKIKTEGEALNQQGVPEHLPIPLGIFLVGMITSSAFTNTQLHIEDLCLMSININIFGSPKIWYWIPQENVPAFKAFAETMTFGGKGDLYTKAVAPFQLDRTLCPAEHRLPLTKLLEFGARRIIQMPGMAVLTSPGYAFHFTVSMGMNVAESCNMFLEILGWTVERLWRERPYEQYPDPENSMVKWMLDSGILEVLGVNSSDGPAPPPALATAADLNGRPPPKPRASRAKPKVDASTPLQKLMEMLPSTIRNELMHRELDSLIEVTMDIGRPATARFINSELPLSSQGVTSEDIAQAMSLVGSFDDDNRAGIDGTLHRISAIKSRSGKVVGLTCRVGRVIEGSSSMVEDLIRGGRNILLLGRPGVGKTTAIRDISFMLSSSLKKRTVIIDTSNEIGGDGDVPHRGIGDARRLQVPKPEQQHKTMTEGVENHFPQSIIIDEIGTEQECQAARTISQRGVQLVGTAHGQSLENLIKNPSLNLLVGGIQNVTLGDEAAKKRNVQKTIQERAGPPTFDVCIEMVERHRWRVHTDVAASVDSILAGREAKVLTRERDPKTGKVQTVTFMGIMRKKVSESDELLTAMEFWRSSDGEDIFRPIEKGSSNGLPTASLSLASLNGGSNKKEEIKFVPPSPSPSPSPSPPTTMSPPNSSYQPEEDIVFRPAPSLLPLPPPPTPTPRANIDTSPALPPSSLPSPPVPSPSLAASIQEAEDLLLLPPPPPPPSPPQRLPRASIPIIDPLGGDISMSRRQLTSEELLRGDVARSEEEAWREEREGGRGVSNPSPNPNPNPNPNPSVQPSNVKGRSNEGPWPKSSPSNITSASSYTLETLKQMANKAPPSNPPSPPPSSLGSNARRVFLYMSDEEANKVEHVLSSLPDFASNATLTRDFDSAQIIIAASKKLRGNPKMKSMLTRLSVPIFALKSTSTASIIRELCPVLGLDPLLSSKEASPSPIGSFEEEDSNGEAVKGGSQSLGGLGRGGRPLSSSDDFADLLEQTVRELKGSPVDRDFATNCLRSFLDELPSGGCQASSIANMVWALSHSKHKKKLIEASSADLDSLLSNCDGRWGELSPRDLLRIACGMAALRFRPPSSSFFSEIEIRIKAGFSAGSYKIEEEERLSAALYTLSVLMEDQEVKSTAAV